MSDKPEYIYWDSKDIPNGITFEELLTKIMNFHPEYFGYVKLNEDVCRHLIDDFKVTFDSKGNPSDEDKIGNFVLYNYTGGPDDVIDNSVLPVALRTTIMVVYGPEDPVEKFKQGSGYVPPILEYYQKWTLDLGDAIYVYSDKEPQWVKLTGELCAEDNVKIIRGPNPPEPPEDIRIMWLDTSKKACGELKMFDKARGKWVACSIPGVLSQDTYDLDRKETDIYQYANDAISKVFLDYGRFLKHKMNELELIHITPDEKIQWDRILTMEELLRIIDEREEECHETIMTLYDTILGINALEARARGTLADYDAHVDEEGDPPHISHKKARTWDIKSDNDHRHDIDPLVSIYGENILTGVFKSERLPDEIKERVIPIPDGIEMMASPDITDEDRKTKYHTGNVLVYDPDNDPEHRKWYKIMDPSVLGTDDYMEGVLEFTPNWDEIKTAEWKYVHNTPSTIAGYNLSATVYTKDEFDKIAKNLISKLNDLDAAIIYLMRPYGVSVPASCNDNPRSFIQVQLGGSVDGTEVDMALHIEGESDAIIPGVSDTVGIGLHVDPGDDPYENDDITTIYDTGKGLGSAWGLVYHTDKEDNCHNGNNSYLQNNEQPYITYGATKGMSNDNALIVLGQFKSVQNPTKMDIGLYIASARKSMYCLTTDNIERKLSVMTILKERGLGTSDENWLPVCWSECEPTDSQFFKTIGLVVKGDNSGYRAIFFKINETSVNYEVINLNGFYLQEVYGIAPHHFKDTIGNPCHFFVITALDNDNKISFINIRIFDLASASGTVIRRQYISPNNVSVNCINNGFTVTNVKHSGMIIDDCPQDSTLHTNIGAFNFKDTLTGHYGSIIYDFLQSSNDETHSAGFIRNISEHTTNMLLGGIVPFDDFRTFCGMNHNGKYLLMGANNTVTGKCSLLKWRTEISEYSYTNHTSTCEWVEMWTPSNHFYYPGKVKIINVEPISAITTGITDGTTADMFKVTLETTPDEGDPYITRVLIYESLEVPGTWETLGGSGYSDAVAYSRIFDDVISARNVLISDGDINVDLTNTPFAIERWFERNLDIADLTEQFKYKVWNGDTFYARLAMGFKNGFYGEIMIGNEHFIDKDGNTTDKLNSVIYAPRLHQIQACLSAYLEWEKDRLDDKLTLAENWLAYLTTPGIELPIT